MTETVLRQRDKPFSERQRRRLSRQYGYGHRPTNDWGSGDLPAPWAEGDLVYLADVGDNTFRLRRMGPGFFVVSCAFSVDEGDGWYFRVANHLDGSSSDRFHVFNNDDDPVDCMAGFELVETSDPEGLAKRKAMLAAGWKYEQRVASVDDYRTALYAAQRALMHADKWVGVPDVPQPVRDIIATALKGADRVLDIGRDETGEQIAT